VQLCEPPDGVIGAAGVGDFGFAIARLLLFSTWRLALFERLESSRDPVIAAVAAKGVKELAYHRDHAARWTVRLGDGTAESHARMQSGLDAMWPYLDELFEPHEVESRLADAGVAVDPSSLRAPVSEVLDGVLAHATLQRPDVRGLARVGGRAGRDGVHTESMSYLLAELQSVARAHPGATW
jgi:ring-1,2-phenylacetyl-CoA epoxidase subunit PaaC